MPPKRAFKPVPDGYVCAACSQAGHWIYDCSQYKKTKKKKTSSHEFQPGVDPSPEDIERAKKMQMEMKDLTKTAPNCFCGLPAKLRKCIGTKLDENSRAKGVMFWWCNKDKWDENACKFARPVTQKKKVCTFWMQTQSCKKGSACRFWHEGEGVFGGGGGGDTNTNAEGGNAGEVCKVVGEESGEVKSVEKVVNNKKIVFDSESGTDSDDSSSSSSSSSSDSDSD